MKPLDLNVSLNDYRIREYFTIYDEYSGEERVRFYRLGWHVFLNNSKSFEQYESFLIGRTEVWNYLFSIPIYSVIATAIFLVIYNRQLNWSGFLISFAFIGILSFIRLVLLRKASNNQAQTKAFLSFIHPEKKKTNFTYFEGIDINDDQSAKQFYLALLKKEDFIPAIKPENINKEDKNYLDKTVKLLAIDLMLGSPGALNDMINKLINASEKKLTKTGIYRVLGKILSASPDNIKSTIERELVIIRTDELPEQRIKQLQAVRNLFAEANLNLLANEVDSLLLRAGNNVKL